MTDVKKIVIGTLAVGAFFGLAAYEAVKTEDAMRANGLISSPKPDISKITEPKKSERNPFAQGLYWR